MCWTRTGDGADDGAAGGAAGAGAGRRRPASGWQPDRTGAASRADRSRCPAVRAMAVAVVGRSGARAAGDGNGCAANADNGRGRGCGGGCGVGGSPHGVTRCSSGGWAADRRRRSADRRHSRTETMPDN